MLRKIQLTKTGVCSSCRLNSLVDGVWLTWWELLPGWRQSVDCLEAGHPLVFLIGGSAVKRLTSLACCFVFCFVFLWLPLLQWNASAREWRMRPPGQRNSGIISTPKHLQTRAHALRQNALEFNMLFVWGYLKVFLYQRETDISEGQFHS